MLANANEKLDSNPKDKATKFETNANLEWIESILGIGYKNPYMYFQVGVNEEEKQEIEKLIFQRTEAKKAKDFTRADEIRETLTCKGIQLMDTPNGTQWEKAE